MLRPFIDECTPHDDERWIVFLSLCQNGDQQQADLRIDAGLSKQPQITVPVSENTAQIHLFLRL